MVLNIVSEAAHVMAASISCTEVMAVEMDLSGVQDFRGRME